MAAGITPPAASGDAEAAPGDDANAEAGAAAEASEAGSGADADWSPSRKPGFAPMAAPSTSSSTMPPSESLLDSTATYFA